MSQTKQINDGLFSRLKGAGAGKAFRQVVTNYHNEESTSGQDAITLPFVVEQDNINNFLLFVDGVKLSSEDYSFTNIISGKSDDIVLSSPLVAGLEIEAYLIGVALSKVNQLTLESNIRDKADKELQSGLSNFIVASEIEAPHTEIQQRAKIPAGFEPSMGIERLLIANIQLKPTEFDDNGANVYEIQSKDNRVRVVGTPTNISTTDGTYVSMSPDDYVEVTFYGTGLNVLANVNASNRDMRVTIDGGTEGSNIHPTGMSSVLNARGYTPKQILPAASGLSLGWHTAKLRNADASEDFRIHGVEILNESETIDSIAGSGIADGLKQILSTVNSSSYNDGISGSKGARVIKYLQNGSISQSVQEVDATALYLGSTDHSNEEMFRKINWREFGINRNDDFSTLTSGTSDRAFPLEDGTTTLIGNDVVAIGGVPQLNSNGAWYEITFVGTGLDIIRQDESNGGTSTIEYFVDGVSVGTEVTGSTSTDPRRFNVCSGLSYGTHIVRIQRNAGTGNASGLTDFFIYQPKKPDIPAGAVEICDYNVLGDFVANSLSTGISQGTLRKNAIREFLYNGTWAVSGTADPAKTGGFNINTSTNGAYTEYTFFGTGFDLRTLRNPDRSGDILLSLDGTALTAANFPTASFSFYGLDGYNTSTGSIDANGTLFQSSGLICEGLPLGLYTLRMTNNTANIMNIHCIDIITPIHINHGSLKLTHGVKANRKFDAMPDVVEDVSMQAKALLYYDNVNGNKILKSKNIAAVVDDGVGIAKIFFEKPFKDSNYVAQVTSDVNANSQTIGLFTEESSGSNTRSPHFCRTLSWNTSSNVATDVPFYLVCYGELIDEE